MSRDKQIEETTCKRCVHYDVCMYVNAKAVEFARAENCKLFKDNADYRRASEVAREIFEEIETSLHYKLINGEIHLIIREADYNEYKKKYIGKDTNVTTNTEV